MSAYSFIASDYELPILDNSKERIITVKEAITLGIKGHEFMPLEDMNPNDTMIFFENESDLGELTIGEDYIYIENVRWYTNKPFIYTVNFTYTNSRAKQLLEYLKENIKQGHQLELWSIWLDDNRNDKIKPVVCNYEEFDLSYINHMYDWNNENHSNYSSIIVKRHY